MRNKRYDDERFRPDYENNQAANGHQNWGYKDDPIDDYSKNLESNEYQDNRQNNQYYDDYQGKHYEPSNDNRYADDYQGFEEAEGEYYNEPYEQAYENEGLHDNAYYEDEACYEDDGYFEGDEYYEDEDPYYYEEMPPLVKRSDKGQKKRLMVGIGVALALVLLSSLMLYHFFGKSKDGGILDIPERSPIETKLPEGASEHLALEEELELEEEQNEELPELELSIEEPEVSREFKNALRSAENYMKILNFSKAGLYDQLTSEYGDSFPPEAAQYAIDNLDVDYKEVAYKAALSYLNTFPVSDQELFDQLVSPYGSAFTEEEAQYAIDKLNQQGE